MSGTRRSSADLDPRRRKIMFRSWHRGMREMDLIMGHFVDEHISDLSDDELDDFELLIEVPDRDLFSWLVSGVDVPSNYDTPVFRRLQVFHTHMKPLHA